MNENDINKIYKNINFERKFYVRPNDRLKDAFDNISSFLSYGAPETSLEKITDKELINDILSDEFEKLADNLQCFYFQEFHNRIAKSLKIPAVNVIIKPDSSSESTNFATSSHRVPIDFVFETNGEKFPNVQLEINNKVDMTSFFENALFKPSTRGLEYIFTIFHETRHMAQLYAEHLLVSGSQILKDNNLNAVAFLDLMENAETDAGKFLGIERKDFYPDIKSKFITQDEKEYLQSYELAPVEIDARKYALEKMDELNKKGLLENTNWEKYRCLYLAEDYEALNFERGFSSSQCPAVNYLRSKKEKLFYGLKRLKELNDRFDIEFPKQISKQINFEKYFDSIQNYYNKVKDEIRVIMIDNAEKLKDVKEKNSEKNDFSESQYYKIRYGSEQINNTNGEYQHSIANKYNGIYEPDSKIEEELKNLRAYRINKELRRKRKEEKENSLDDFFDEYDESVLFNSKNKNSQKSSDDYGFERE